MKRPVPPITVQDPLYGQINLPRYLRRFLLSPEFARLGGVRLLNSDSLELAALSEVRRRSHTLGVLHLGTRLTLLEFGADEIKALLFAIVLHDVGTPPFGHTVEYEYIRRLGLNHESAATRLLSGQHHTLSFDHQVFGGSVVQLHRLIEQTDCADTVRAILEGGHPLSTLLFGDLDLDNLDNVYRMAWYLGEKCDPGHAVRLASLVDVDRKGTKFLAREHQPLVEEWARLRAHCYRVLFCSPLHRQRQAIFSRIVFESMEDSNGASLKIEEDDWFLTDEDLLQRLRRDRRLKPFFADYDYDTELPELEFEFESDLRLDRAALMMHRDAISLALRDVGGTLYITLIPFGEALERRVQFVDRSSGKEWSVGSPRLIYRLYVHIGGSAARKAGVADLKPSLHERVKNYFEAAGWAPQTRKPAKKA